MSTSRRLAKRSIIGTKVCAPGPDGLWYSGVIQDVKTPSLMSGVLAPPPEPMPPPTFLAPGDAQLNADTRYIVRFDFKTTIGVGDASVASASASSPSESVIVETRRAAAAAAAAASVHISPAQALRRNAMTKEFRESDLIGPGFRSIMSIQLQPGQRIFLTYNGREQSGDVVQHDVNKDEVVVKITTVGNEEPIELKKRLEEVRLLESRRSARLADQDRDTDFARLADMGGDRRRTTHSIEVPMTLTPSHNSRKRPQSDTCDCSCDQCKKDACHAALILLHLHNSNQNVSEKWLGSSPGSSSSASWSSGSASPPLSDDGNVLHGHINLSPHDAATTSANARIRTTSVSTSDEGIVIDFKEERKKKVSACHTALPHCSTSTSRLCQMPNATKKFRCTWKGCDIVELTQLKIERHVRDKHLGKKARRSGDSDSCSENEHEEEFYYTEDDDDDELVKTPSPASPPTLSHRDMARPPHEDPEYQRQIVGNFKQGRAMNNYHHLPHQQQQQLHHSSSGGGGSNGSGHITTTQQQQLQNNNTSCIPTSPLVHHNYNWSSTGAITVSPSSTSHQAHHHSSNGSGNGSVTGSSSNSSNTTTLNKHARSSSSRPSHSTAPYPSPTYVHHQNNHNFSHNSSIGSSNSSNHSHSNSSSSNSSPVIHSNSSANNMLQQLSQQNVTVTAHHTSGNTPQHQQQHHLSSVTITPNYHPPQHQQQQQQHQQHLRGQQQTTASNNIVANSGQHMQPLQHVAVQQTVSSAKHTPNSPNRRTRGENKKCRKVYGMDKRELWCTQCKWKKACSRFGD